MDTVYDVQMRGVRRNNVYNVISWCDTVAHWLALLPHREC